MLQISIWYQIDDQKDQKIEIEHGLPCMGCTIPLHGATPPYTPSPYMGFFSENHVLRHEITHAGPLHGGSVSENHTHVKPMTSKGAIFSPLPPTSGIRETDGLMIGVIQAGSLAGWVVVWLSAWLAD